MTNGQCRSDFDFTKDTLFPVRAFEKTIILKRDLHDDVINWKHFPRYWPLERGIHRSRVNSPHKGQWRGAFICSLICAWINGRVNNRKAGDLRRHRTHYDVTVHCNGGLPQAVNGLRFHYHCAIYNVCKYSRTVRSEGRIRVFAHYTISLSSLCTLVLTVWKHWKYKMLITMTSQWTWWRLKSPASRLFTQAFVQAQIKKNIKAPRHWPLWW